MHSGTLRWLKDGALPRSVITRRGGRLPGAVAEAAPSAGTICEIATQPNPTLLTPLIHLIDVLGGRENRITFLNIPVRNSLQTPAGETALSSRRPTSRFSVSGGLAGRVDIGCDRGTLRNGRGRAVRCVTTGSRVARRGGRRQASGGTARRRPVSGAGNPPPRRRATPRGHPRRRGGPRERRRHP